MATEALEHQQAKTRAKAAMVHRPKPTLRKNPDKNRAASVVSMMLTSAFGDSIHSALTTIDRESNNNPLALPFPVIRWEDDYADDEDMALIKKEESLLKEQIKITYRKKRHCLRRSLACREHLSLLALDQIASMNEDDELEQRRKLRLMSCPY